MRLTALLHAQVRLFDVINEFKPKKPLSASEGFALDFQTARLSLLIITKVHLRISLRDRTALFLFLMP